MVPGWKKSGGYSRSAVVGQVSFKKIIPRIWGLVQNTGTQVYPGFHLRMSGRMELILPDDCLGTPEVAQVVDHSTGPGSYVGPMVGSCGKPNQKPGIWRWLEYPCLVILGMVYGWKHGIGFTQFQLKSSGKGLWALPGR